MKRFDFPLERVRRWRSEQLSLEELKLGQIRAEREKLAAERKQIERNLADSQTQVLSGPFLSAFELETLDSYRLHVRDRLRALEDRERACDARMNAQRERVLQARRGFELLDRLRGKAYRAWCDASEKEQEQLAAELFLAKAIRDR